MEQTEKKELSILKISLPIFFEILLFMFLGIADTFMLSHYGTMEMAQRSVDAVGMSNQIMNMVNIFFSFISAGTAVLIAQYIGAGKKHEVKRVISVSLGLNVIVGAIFTFILLVFGRDIFIILGLYGERLEYAVSYMNIVGGFMIAQALLNTVAATIRSHGDTHITLMVTIGMNIINVIGDAAFIYGLFGFPVLGVKGVAIATTFSRVLALIVSFIILFRNYLNVSDLKYILEKPIKEVKGLLNIGVPSAMENLSYNIYQTATAAIVMRYLPAAAFTTRIYAFQISWFILLFGAAIGQGTQIMIGQYVGAKEYDKAYRANMNNFKVAFIITCVLSVGLFFGGERLMMIYTDNPEIIHLGGIILMVDAIMEPGRTFNLVLINGLRGAGDVIFPVVMAIIFMWGLSLGFGFILAVPLKMGLVGFWIGMTLDEWLRGIVMYFRWRSGKWRTKSLV